MTLPKRTSLIVMLTMIALSTATFAQQSTSEDPVERSRQTRPSRKPATTEPVEQIEQASRTQETDEAMRRALADLATQIGLLTGEVRRLRRETERNSGVMELLLNEDRLAKLEDKVHQSIDQKAQLDAREQEFARRMRNIQGELVLRGGVRREESEAAIRNEFQRALEDLHNQQASSQQRMAELTDQAAKLRARVETLRKKIESADAKSDKEEK